ncbi:CIC family chloride channel protein [Amaricoccus macauensis]|uniref:CIC family chloride channel protein n=1 Tax=Amaricoccus macauensis TaxID=57001 RepID=A0A840SK12_9RHOB|nr:chloride channel protein [Amaricoccus macauensis]MBB5220488.1 CIC family chloride channel protein [Amaricoccus macauensis]
MDEHLPFSAPKRLRALVRSRESSIIVLAAVVGAAGGLVVAGMGALAELMHSVLFGIPFRQRLSALPEILPWQALIPAVGGVVLGLSFLLLAKWRPEPPVDPIEANALRGGRMSIRDSAVVAAQTVWSSGVGASVGLEAGYTQLSSGLASWLGRVFHVRRNDLRLLVGCGTAGAIAGAFGAPLGGAFYAFELVIGAYAPIGLAPVGIAALNGWFVARALGPHTLELFALSAHTITGRDLVTASLLGVAAAFFGITLMRGVELWERLMRRLHLPMPVRLGIGGSIVGGLALVTPQVLASGHGALHVNSVLTLPIGLVAIILVCKSVASIVSLGSGFRGGLFFASLLLGALGGRLFAEAGNALWPGAGLESDVYAVLGLGALSASVIGGPLTMTFIVLETTGDFWLAAAVLIAVIVATVITRELFGYSFATWRFHLRGETIRSAADVGWIRDLTVGRMMRPDLKTVPRDTSLERFRELYPLGSATRVVVLDRDETYAGMVIVTDAHGVTDPEIRGIGPILRLPKTVLKPSMNIREAALQFDRAEAEALAVTDAQNHPVGLLTEAYVLRRYADESERRRREMLGEG